MTHSRGDDQPVTEIRTKPAGEGARRQLQGTPDSAGDAAQRRHFGVFGGATPEQARAIEALGYNSVWIGGSPPGDLLWADSLLRQTDNLIVASGIINIWSARASDVADAYHRLEDRHPGRFLLGIGVGHPEADSDYRHPIAAVNTYLDDLDRHGVPSHRRVVAAVGPAMVKIAASRSAGAHPFLTTPAHTAQTRSAMGDTPLLVPEQKVVVSDDVEYARRVARSTLTRYLALENARSNLKRQGFTDEDITPPGSDRLTDTLVRHGSADLVAEGLRQHITAGADHVAIWPLGPQERLIDSLTSVAVALGLDGSNTSAPG